VDIQKAAEHVKWRLLWFRLSSSVHSTMSRALGREAHLGSAVAAHSANKETESLLRLFESPAFNEWIAVSYLWRTKSEVSIATATRCAGALLASRCNTRPPG